MCAAGRFFSINSNAERASASACVPAVTGHPPQMVFKITQGKLFTLLLIGMEMSGGCGASASETTTPRTTPPPQRTLEERIHADGVDASMFDTRTAEEARGNPPEQAYGFEFGSSAESSASFCTESGEKWKVLEEGQRFYCSSAPRDSQASGSPPTHAVILKLCEGKVCQIFVDVSPAGDDVPTWVKAYREREANMIEKYGKPTRLIREIPEACRRRFLECIQGGEARISSLWSWPSGGIISLSMAGDKSKGVPPNISVQFADSSGVRAIEGAVE